MDSDAEASKEAQGIEEKARAGRAFFVGQDFRVGETRMVVDRQMDVFPADPAGVALAVPVSGDAVADAIELAELLDGIISRPLGVKGAFLCVSIRSSANH